MKIINQGLGFEGTRKTILSNYSLHQHATQEVSILFSVLPHPNPASISPSGTSGIGTVFITGGKKREKNLLSWSRNEIWNEMSWKRERLKRKRKKSPSKESIPGDKPALDLWRAGRASKQHLIMGFQAGFHKMSLAAPCRKPVAIVALLSDANSCPHAMRPHYLERSNYASLVSLEMLALSLSPALALEKCPLHSKDSTVRQCFYFRTESLQNTKWACKMDLHSPEACLAGQKRKPVHCQE